MREMGKGKKGKLEKERGMGTPGTRKWRSRKRGKCEVLRKGKKRRKGRKESDLIP